jgi:hypothetical protein
MLFFWSLFARFGANGGTIPGVKIPDSLGGPVVLESSDVLQGLGLGGLRRVRRVDCWFFGRDGVVGDWGYAEAGVGLFGIRME